MKVVHEIDQGADADPRFIGISDDEAEQLTAEPFQLIEPAQVTFTYLPVGSLSAIEGEIERSLTS